MTLKEKYEELLLEKIRQGEREAGRLSGLSFFEKENAVIEKWMKDSLNLTVTILKDSIYHIQFQELCGKEINEENVSEMTGILKDLLNLIRKQELLCVRVFSKTDASA